MYISSHLMIIYELSVSLRVIELVFARLLSTLYLFSNSSTKTYVRLNIRLAISHFNLWLMYNFSPVIKWRCKHTKTYVIYYAPTPSHLNHVVVMRTSPTPKKRQVYVSNHRTPATSATDYSKVKHIGYPPKTLLLSLP